MFDGILEAIYSLFLLIDSALLQLMSWMYGVYIEIANVTLVSTEIYYDITSRIYVVVGVVALFVVAYSLLQNVINPEGKQSDSGVQFVKKIIIAFVVVLLVPTIFEFIYGLQSAILKNSVIEQIIFADGLSYNTILNFEGEYVIYTSIDADDNGETEFYLGSDCELSNFSNCNIYATSGGTSSSYLKSNTFTADDISIIEQQQQGNMIANYVLETFLTVKTNKVSELRPEETSNWIGTDTSDYSKVLSSGNYSWNNVKQYIVFTGEFSKILPFAECIVNGTMGYVFIVPLIVTAAILYFLVLFILDLGLRVIKLSFYQIIAPIPIFMSITPKNDGALKNWFKIVMTVYCEVFIRVGVMTLGIYFISLITKYFFG